jgi:phage FluMu protein Com
MFYTQNYTIIWCDKCNERLIIEPGKGFEKFDCKCVKEVNNGVKPRAANQAQRKSKEHQE